MKKFFICALTAMAFVACSENNENGNEPNQKGELEQSYVAITLAADDMTRAEGDKYEDGLPAESAVKSAHVFFFRDGVAFPVSDNDGTTTNAGGQNWLSLNLTMNDEGDATNNISDYSNEILVIENYKGEYPNQVVAVLNWTPTVDLYDLTELQAELLNIGNTTNGFVMCNAVYADESTPKKTMIATPITEANIGTKNDLNELEAVQIYVERLAAKVVFTTQNANGKFDTGATVVDRSTNPNTEIKVYAKVKGYELFDAYYDSWLVKKIDPNWSNTDLGFTWNDSPFYRSYWANSDSAGKAFPDSNKFNWSVNAGEEYCGENTYREANDRTKVIVKAQLVDENDNPVEVVNWLGQDYVGEDYLKIVVANTLNQKYFSSTDQKEYNGITPDDLKCVARQSNVDKAYYVYFQLTDGNAKIWYERTAEGKYIAVANMNNKLNEVHPALVYNDGMTYYYTDIRHLAPDKAKTGAYGIVRNHVYKVNITDINGFGTPVYEPTQDFIEVETPENIRTYVSAQINILSWRVVSNNYEI